MGWVTKLPGSRLFFNLFQWSTITKLIDHQKLFQSRMNENHTSYIVMHQPKSKFLLGQLPLRMPIIPVTSPSSNLPRGWVSVGQIILLLTLRHFEIPYNPTKKNVLGNDSYYCSTPYKFRWGCQDLPGAFPQMIRPTRKKSDIFAASFCCRQNLIGSSPARGLLDLAWVESYKKGPSKWDLHIPASVKQGKNNHIIYT